MSETPDWTYDRMHHVWWSPEAEAGYIYGEDMPWELKPEGEDDVR